MKVLKGELVERRFAIPQRAGELRETSRREYGVGKVTYMADQVSLFVSGDPDEEEKANYGDSWDCMRFRIRVRRSML
jgi:hypothetical protein